MSEPAQAKRVHHAPPRRVTVLEPEAVRRQERARQDNAKAELELAAAQDRLLRERLARAKPVQRQDADAFLGALLLEADDQGADAADAAMPWTQQDTTLIDQGAMSSLSAFYGGGGQHQGSQTGSRQQGQAASGSTGRAGASVRQISMDTATPSDDEEGLTSMVVEVKDFGAVQLTMQKIAGRWHASLTADSLEKNQQLSKQRAVLERGLSQYVSVPISLTIAEI